jgi:hypothetical protein
VEQEALCCFPKGAMNFHVAMEIAFRISYKMNKVALKNFKGLSQDRGRTKYTENLRASPFNQNQIYLE